MKELWAKIEELVLEKDQLKKTIEQRDNQYTVPVHIAKSQHHDYAAVVLTCSVNYNYDQTRDFRRAKLRYGLSLYDGTVQCSPGFSTEDFGVAIAEFEKYSAVLPGKGVDPYNWYNEVLRNDR